MVMFVLSLAGCSTARPILYPNAHLQSVGQVAADRDIEECERKAKAAGADRQTGRAGEVAAGRRWAQEWVPRAGPSGARSGEGRESVPRSGLRAAPWSGC